MIRFNSVVLITKNAELCLGLDVMLCNQKCWSNTNCCCGTGALWAFCDVLGYCENNSL